MSNDCSCEICKDACTYNPGWFMPGEVEKVAEYLSVPLQELFETKLGVNWYVGEKDIFLLAPAILNMQPGKEYPADPRGQCIFFDSESKLCLIHSVKPFECREYYHDADKAVLNRTHKNVAESWNNYQDQIELLLGCEPEAENYNPFGFGFFGPW